MRLLYTIKSHLCRSRPVRLAGFVLVAVSASLAVSPFASATVWKESETAISSGESRNVTITAESPFVLRSTIGGVEFELTANQVEGVGFQIAQSGSGEVGEALQHGRLRLSELTIVKPAGCETAAEITTNFLTAEMLMSGSAESEVVATVRPATGEELATVPIEGCALEGELPLTSSMGVPCEAKDKTTIETQKQVLECREALVTLEKAKVELAGAWADFFLKIEEALGTAAVWGVSLF